MARYNVVMQVTMTTEFDTEEYDFNHDPETVEEGRDPNNPRDVHKYIQQSWPDVFGLDMVDGQFELNELKVKKAEA